MDADLHDILTILSLALAFFTAIGGALIGWIIQIKQDANRRHRQIEERINNVERDMLPRDEIRSNLAAFKEEIRLLTKRIDNMLEQILNIHTKN